MRSADHTIRQRRQEDQPVEGAPRAHRRPAGRLAREELIDEVERLVPLALMGLEQAGWPGGQLFKVRGVLRAKEVAGWAAGGYRFHAQRRGGPDRIEPLFLLEDGRWLYGHRADPTSFAEVLHAMGDGDSPHALRAGPLPEGVSETLRRFAAGDAVTSP